MDRVKKQTTIVLFTVLIGSFVFLHAVSEPIPGTMIVQMGKDRTLEKSVQTLVENIDDAFVVHFGTLEFAIKAHRVINPVIWVGHGNNQGIVTNEGTLEWSTLAQYIKKTVNVDFILACHSYHILEQSDLSKKEVTTVLGEIDAIYGALMVSLYFRPSINLAQKALNYNQKLYAGVVELRPLYYEPHVVNLDSGGGGSNSWMGDGGSSASGEYTTGPPIPADIEEAVNHQDGYILSTNLSVKELIYWVFMFFILLFQIGLGVITQANKWPFLAESVNMALKALIVAQIFNMFMMFIRGFMTFEDVIASLGGIFLGLGGLLINALHAASKEEFERFAILILVAGGIQLLTTIFSCGGTVAARITTGLVLVTAVIYGFVQDFIDPDPYIGGGEPIISLNDVISPDYKPKPNY